MRAKLRWMTLSCSLLLMLPGFNMETILEHSETEVYRVQILHSILHTVQHTISIVQCTLYTVTCCLYMKAKYRIDLLGPWGDTAWSKYLAWGLLGSTRSL